MDDFNDIQSDLTARVGDSHSVDSGVTVRVSEEENIPTWMNVNTLNFIVKDLKPYKPNIFLAKPDRTIVAKLTEAYDVNTKRNYGGIHEISFKLPYIVNRYHRKIRNDHVDVLRGHFLLKVDDEWYVINKPKKTASDGKEILEVSGYLLPYQLRNKLIRLYKETKKASEVLTDCLEGTHWTVGYVDADFNLMYRSFDVSEKTALDFLSEIRDTFDGIYVYDTENRIVHLYKEQNLGVDRGLTIRYGKYLKSINEDPNFDDVCTRLYLFGKDNISINGVNPTGSSFIEDFTYYLYPYSETITDAATDTYTVNQSSNYMSDELCHAILKHSALIESKRPDFNGLIDRLLARQNELQTLKDQWATLSTDMLIILDNLTHYQATHNNQSDPALITQRDNKQAEINNKNAAIAAKNTEISDTQALMNSIITSLSLENNFTTAQITERDSYIFERKWSDGNYDDTKELLERGKTEIIKQSQPHIQYDIDVVDFLKVVECQRDWDKIGIGDIVTVKYDNLKIGIKAKLINIEHDHDNNNIRLQIANDKDIKSGFLALRDIIKNNVSTSTLLDISKYSWDLATDAYNKVGNLIASKIDANKNLVEAGESENYTFGRDGITMRDPNDPLNYLRILHNIVAFTNDGGNTFKHAITPNGIVGEYIYGRIITGENLIIGDSDGILEILGNTMVIKDRNGNIVMKLGLYETLVNDGADKFGLITYNSRNRVIVDRDNGFKIKRFNVLQNTWDDIAWLDTDGILHTEAMVAKKIQIVNGTGIELLNADTGHMNIGQFEQIITDGKLTAIEKLQVKVEWEKIKAEKIQLMNQAVNYATIDRDTNTHVSTTGYEAAYAALETYITPLLSDMAATSTVDRTEFNLKFQSYYDEAIKLINAITDALRYASVQLGRNYNNVIIDAINGFMATRSDGLVRTMMNATDGIKIQRLEGATWTDKFYVDTYGILHAEDLIAKRLILRNGNDELILDANTNFLDLSVFDKIIGYIRVENLQAASVIAGEGIINDLTVNRLRTTDTDTNPINQNYIDIKGNTAEWITGTRIDGSYAQATNKNGLLLYYTNATQTVMTLDPTAYPVMTYNYTRVPRLKISFDDQSSNSVPYMAWGIGDGSASNNGKAFIRKNDGNFLFNYYDATNANERKFVLQDSGILIETLQSGTVQIKKGTSIISIESDGTIKLTHSSGSYISVGSDIRLSSTGNLYLN